MPRSESIEWYRRAFADDYLWIYSHRSEEDAEKEVASAIRHLPFESGQHVLDLACGAGRHMLAFSDNGAKVTGVDLSDTLLKEAHRRFDEVGRAAELVRADMRYLPFSERFDGVTMWFTSFGYFETVREDALVLKTIRDVLRKTGWWWIDIPNPAHLAKTLVPKSRRELDGPNGPAEVIEKRRITGSQVVKKIEINDSSGKRCFEERVRLYPPEHFGSLVKRAGLTALGVLGDYDGSPFTPSVPRQIWYGTRK
ncbi:MAG: class I SAM-dependent methyltransferase [candidate division Zixibacteria bacterium]|nr:class I SAM-dependent methyltransferase [candidate division Zixibacteria bacterium]MBU1470277.1 class I SAM-dependent methyltransferase [candidate division Zixibacteria bacterium]MBU2626837.1 class I SAM-dependent methyltransferase [candidate division Zixibacteria bacterium]